MGASPSSEQDVRTWKIEDVKALEKRWKGVCDMEFAMTLDGLRGFASLMGKAGYPYPTRPITNREYINDLWNRFTRPFEELKSEAASNSSPDIKNEPGKRRLLCTCIDTQQA